MKNTVLYLSALLAFVISSVAGAGVANDGGQKYRILAFLPIASKSHHRVWQPLLRELATRGHHVTYVTPIPMSDPPTNMSIISLGNDEEILKEVMERTGVDQADIINMRGFRKHFAIMRMLRLFGVAMAEMVFENREFQKLIESDLQFDGIIVESTFVQEAFIALKHRFNAVAIEVMTAGNLHWGYFVHGNPYDTSYIIDSSLPFTDKMNFMERLHNTVNSLITRVSWDYWYVPMFQDLMDKHFRYPGWQSRPPMLDMVRETAVVLVNTHYTLNYPFPLAAHFKEVGGLNLVPVKPLPKDLQDFMDGAKDGVVYFTLGSYLQVSSTLGERLGPIFARVFSKLKQRVLMKWEVDFPNLPSNVKISKWFPQQDILAHKNLKLFISHGGFLSLTEAVNQGVPILGIPMVGDQVKNIRVAEHNGYGLGLEFENITESTLAWAVNEMLTNPQYAKKAKEQSKMFRDKQETALETAVYWTEYALKHKGADHLKPAIASMPWYQQSLVDVYLLMAAIVLIPLYVVFKLVRCIFKCLCKSNKSSKKKKD